MEIKALVANSSKKDRSNISKSLKEIGVRKITEATDGKEAIELLQKGKYDVIFAESNPQWCEGEEFWKTARKNDSKLPIFVTAPQSKKVEELKKAYPNATSYISMPFTKEQLQQTVGQYLPTVAV
jgi:two-component system, chemotaxis family, chemotaxis protein CheY